MQLEKINLEPGHEAFQKTNIIEVMIRTLPKYKPQFEMPADLLRRKVVIDEFLKEYLRCNPLAEGKKNAIVCHSLIIATMTSQGEDPSDRKGLKSYTWTQNCQLLPYLNM